MILIIARIFYLVILLIYYPILNTIKYFISYRYRAKKIKNEIALVTGAGSGIGKSLAKKLAKEGAILILWDIDAASNNETKNEIEALGGKAYAYKCDLSKKDEVYRIARKVQQEVGDVTILVNNAGIVSGKKLLESSDSAIEKTFQVNTLAHFWTVRAFLQSMLDKNHGHIVTIASTCGLTGFSGLVDYCSSKFGAVGFDESLRNELLRLGKTGVKRTVVCPDAINTGMFAGIDMSSMLEPEYVTDEILQAILTNQKMLLLPREYHIFLMIKYVLPVEISEYINDVLKVNYAMDTFVGRSKNE